jgi:hypothetical protein
MEVPKFEFFDSLNGDHTNWTCFNSFDYSYEAVTGPDCMLLQYISPIFQA